MQLVQMQASNLKFAFVVLSLTAESVYATARLVGYIVENHHRGFVGICLQ